MTIHNYFHFQNRFCLLSPSLHKFYPSYSRLLPSYCKQVVWFTWDRLLAWSHNPPLLSGLGTDNMAAKPLNPPSNHASRVFIEIDVNNGCTYHKNETFMRQKLHKISVIDWSGLLYRTTFVIDKPYIITTTIDVTYRLSNILLPNKENLILIL